MPSLRVIGGSARGRRLSAVPGDTTRPITDRTKEALFNIIGGDIQNAAFLDLFAGTGAVGIEALSRGATFTRFLDLEPRAIQTIHRNLEATGYTARAEVQRLDAFTLLARPPDRSFEYIYIAPPQYKDLWSRALLTLDANLGWLVEDGWAIAQIYPKEYQALTLKEIHEFDQRRYGSTMLLFFSRALSDD